MRAWRPLLLLALAVAFGWAATRAIRTWRRPSGRLQELTIYDAPDHWRAGGFVLLTAPLRAPSNADATDQTEVWLKLPPGSILRTRRLPDGRTTFTVPPGTIADRVELIGGRVADVRGTRFEEGGREIFHAFRPEPDAEGRRLFGYEWERGNSGQEGEAAGLFDARLRKTEGARAAGRFRELMACAGCHPANKPPNTRPGAGGLPNRATDGSGLYQLLAVLSDESPLEAYRPREMNLDNPLVVIRCGGGGAPRTVPGKRGGMHVVCSDGSVPLGRLELPAALRAGDARARQICEARRVLEEHLDHAGRRAFAAALGACSAVRP